MLNSNYMIKKVSLLLILVILFSLFVVANVSGISECVNDQDCDVDFVCKLSNIPDIPGFPSSLPYKQCVFSGGQAGVAGASLQGVVVRLAECSNDDDCPNNHICNGGVCTFSSPSQDIYRCDLDPDNKPYFEYRGLKTGFNIVTIKENERVNVVVPLRAKRETCNAGWPLMINITDLEPSNVNRFVSSISHGTAFILDNVSGKDSNGYYKFNFNKTFDTSRIPSSIGVGGSDKKGEFFIIGSLRTSEGLIATFNNTFNNIGGVSQRDINKTLLHVIPKEICNNEIDDDNDTLKNCADNDCAQVSFYCLPLTDLRFDLEDYRDYNGRNDAKRMRPIIDKTVNLSNNEFIGLPQSLKDSLLSSPNGAYTIELRYKFNPDPTKIKGTIQSPLRIYPVFSMGSLGPNVRPNGELFIGVNETTIFVYNNGSLLINYTPTNPLNLPNNNLMNVVVVVDQTSNQLGLYLNNPQSSTGIESITVNNYTRSTPADNAFAPLLGAIAAPTYSGYQTAPITFDRFVIYNFEKVPTLNSINPSDEERYDPNFGRIADPLIYLNFTNDLSDYKGRFNASFSLSPSFDFAGSLSNHGKAVRFTNNLAKNITRPGALTSAVSLTNEEAYTIESWFKFDNSTAVFYQEPYKPYFPIIDLGLVTLSINSSCLLFVTNAGTKVVQKCYSNNYFTDWHHVALVIDKNNNINQKIKLYLDGVLVDFSAQSPNVPQINVTIGGKFANGLLYSSFGGLLDDIKIFNYVRSLDLINADMANVQCNSVSNCPDDWSCENKECIPPLAPPPGDSCNNGVQDNSETGVDCGGNCVACGVAPPGGPILGLGNDCNPATPCNPELTCNPATNKCVAAEVCDGDLDCPSSKICENDVCLAPKRCDTSTECNQTLNQSCFSRVSNNGVCRTCIPGNDEDEDGLDDCEDDPCVKNSDPDADCSDPSSGSSCSDLPRARLCNGGSCINGSWSRVTKEYYCCAPSSGSSVACGSDIIITPQGNPTRFDRTCAGEGISRVTVVYTDGRLVTNFAELSSLGVNSNTYTEQDYGCGGVQIAPSQDGQPVPGYGLLSILLTAGLLFFFYFRKKTLL